MAAPDIGVVHLVRTRNKLRLLEEFIHSYQENHPELPHDLIILLKGFRKGQELDDTLSILQGVECKTLMIPDEGYDIASYFLAIKQLDHRFLCFLNSHSILQDPLWLEKMYEHVLTDGVGAVGATGSWQSHYSAASRWNLPGTSRLFIWRSLRYVARRLRGWLYLRPDFAPFPNYHLRTNAFLLPREVMLALSDSPARTKWDALRFESGKQGLTARIFDMKLQVLVVGKDGNAYEPGRWDQSRTFWSGSQSNLLVADNRTTQYLQSSLEMKWLMEEFAWGRRFSVEESPMGMTT